MTPLSSKVFSAKASAPLALIALPGATALAEKVDKHLITMLDDDSDLSVKRPSYIVTSSYPRFTTGDGKAIIGETVRGRDLYIIVDVGNHGETYDMMGHETPKSPDEHYADLRRVICAAGGKPEKITVIMPLLYGGRQHRRNGRESLDCAMMLQELERMGVKDIITFDAHDPRVQNAVPFMGFDNFFPTYQILKALSRKFPDIRYDKQHLMVVSPDEGAMPRNIYYASVLGLDLGMFYKRRDYATIVKGRNPIIAHEYLGNSVMGMDILVADDIVATGDSVIKLAKELKEKGANRIFITATFALFTEGVSKFDSAYEEKIIDGVISTNLTYTLPELKTCAWYVEADLSKYIAYIIAACTQKESVSALLDPHEKIQILVNKLSSK
ncbi:MAG: ribose-phosphate pyrophosphokinase [Clostridiaceae bacterium]|jgi:ribose-phosphate pyrophosphokinase|nr:ribose-phosphate pyrophosphokinase [Clostridiaceae bacterium]